MCGLLAILETPDSKAPAPSHAQRAEQLIDRLTHRGPDERGTLALDHAWLGHRRLAIVSPESGQQPIAHDPVAWVSNSEIYNHKALRTLCDSVPTSTCDSAVIGPVLAKFGIEGIAKLHGQFALVVQHTDSPDWIAARDHMGICPLYIGHHADGTLWFASEMKALIDDCDRVELVEPGTAWVRDKQGVRCVRWYTPEWMHETPKTPADHTALRDTLIRAVEMRMMGDVLWGVLLSGGLDSSLVASIANRASIRAGYGPIHTFAIGLDGSPDLDCARQAASFLGTQHHEFRFTTEEALEALPTVLEHLESDQQVRTAVPTYLLARCVRAMGFKMVLSGEGADEIFAGYLYFHKAPSPEALHQETVRKVTRLHQYDVMRANKAPMAFGLELRFPFLDRDLIDHTMSIRPADRAPAPRMPGQRPTEKRLLRAAFDDAQSPWLPESILWRQKEQFSDGVGYGWVDTLRAHAARLVDAESLAGAAERFPEGTPPNAEMYWMRELFEERFVHGRRSGRSPLRTLGGGASIACSTPEALDWDPSWKALAGDISGRTIVDIHDAQADLHDCA
ncbi:MAG: asparagine synthase B [Phycisphaerales bacterium]|nr:asparagine synthase B [Phycisphaerales bacterium]